MINKTCDQIEPIDHFTPRYVWFCANEPHFAGWGRNRDAWQSGVTKPFAACGHDSLPEMELRRTIRKHRSKGCSSTWVVSSVKKADVRISGPKDLEVSRRSARSRHGVNTGWLLDIGVPGDLDGPQPRRKATQGGNKWAGCDSEMPTGEGRGEAFQLAGVSDLPEAVSITYPAAEDSKQNQPKTALRREPNGWRGFPQTRWLIE